MTNLKLFLNGKLNLYIFSLFIFIFFTYYVRHLDYGLPYFYNADEIAHLKSVLYFFGYFSDANQNIVEPIYSPFLNFILSSIIILIYNLFYLNLSFSELEGFFFLNPDQLILVLRFASLIFSCAFFFMIFLICKKLKFKTFTYIILSVSLFFSPFILDTALVVGKNSILNFLFLLQFYFFLKYLLKIENFKFKSYILFSILGSLAWGVNYWCATPSLYAVAILHYKKFKYKKIKNIILFIILFFLIGILPNALITSDNPLVHLFADTIINSKDYYENSNKLFVFFEDIKNTFIIFSTFEKFLLICLVISLFLNQRIQNNNVRIVYFSTLFLSAEPILLFAVADYAYPQLRYFGPSFVFMYLNIFMILNKIKFEKFQSLLSITIISIYFLLIFSFENKIKINNNYLNVLKNKYNQYEALSDVSKKFKNTLILMPAVYRENIQSLNLYSELLNSKIISLNPNADGKNSLEQIEYKKNKILQLKIEKNLIPNSNNYIFFGGEFVINDNQKFIKRIQKKYDYILIPKGYVEINENLKSNFNLISIYEGSNIDKPRTYLKNYKNYNFKNIKLGPSLLLYSLKDKT